MATLIRAIVGYFVLLLVVRVLTRRAGSQVTPFDFVLIFLMGGTIILSTVGKDRSVTNCTCAILAVGLLHTLLSWAKTKSPRMGRLLDGTPLVVIRKGVWQQEVLHRKKLRFADIEAAARQAGMRQVEDVEYAILERNGRISVFGRK
ncbi:MAG: DUF421 domain-containing protein [Acidobacteriota bacterium]